jgi:hypothetical protein
LALFVLPDGAYANGADLPPEIILQGFVKQDGDRVRLVARVPLVLLSTFNFPKRGPGYLDLARMDERLQQAAAATGMQIQLAEDQNALSPTVLKARISPLSDRSFQRYDSALAHVEGPPLPVDTDLFRNQGFFDVELGYRTSAANPRLSTRVNVAPEMGTRVRLKLDYLPAGAAPKHYELTGGTDWVSLDPQWYQAAWTFMKSGFFNAFTIDRLVFLLCLIGPFTRLRGVLWITVLMVLLQASTVTAVASGVASEAHWLPAVFGAILAASCVLLAIGNLAAPTLRRRTFLVAMLGTLGGFGLGHLLSDLLQFAGEHAIVSIVFFNLALALGEIVASIVVYFALRAIFSVTLGPVLGVVVLSVIVALVGANWLADGSHELAHELGHAVSEGVGRALPVLLSLIPAALVGVAAPLLLPRRFDGARTESLREALLSDSKR